MAELSPDGLMVHVTRAIGEITKNSAKKHNDLRDSCKLSLDLLRRCQTLVPSPGLISEAPDPAKDVKADVAVTQVLRTMRMSIATKLPKIVLMALDCIQKMMTLGIVKGQDTRDDGKGEARAVELAVESITSCLDVPDAAVHQQMLKCIVTVVTMPGADLHDACLMSAVNAVLKIHTGPYPSNVEASKGILRQIVTHVFTKMETEVAAKAQRAPPTVTVVAPVPAVAVAVPERQPTPESSPSPEPSPVPAAEPETTREFAQRLVMEMVNKALGEEVQVSDSDDEEDEEEAKAKAKKAKEAEAEAEAEAAKAKAAPPADEAELLINDCLSLFRELCSVSAKDNLQTETAENESALKAKVLALELLFEILSKCGTAFKSDPRFIGIAVKKHMCEALLQTMLSPVPRVLKFSLSIFIELLQHFKEPLKAEIGVFFDKIFLRLLESPSSTTQQRWMVLQLLNIVCKDPTQLAEFYLNYDCDLESADIFQRMVNDLSKVAQGPGAAAPTRDSPQQDMALRTLGLECLVMILRSLVDWSKETAPATSASPLPRESLTMSASYRDLAVDGVSPEPQSQSQPQSEGEGTEGEGLGQLQRQKKHKAAVEEVRSKFSLAPKKGIEHAVRLGLIPDNTAESVGAFLRDEAIGFDKRVLGEFICGSKPLNKACLTAFVKRCKFPGMQIDEALREFVSLFQMSGEGQVVDRLMDNFGARYFEDNAADGHFADADAVYKLGYAIIMLATDIHNPMVKNKIKFEDWMQMVTGPKGLGMSFEEDYLRAIHDRIAARPLELKDSGSSGLADLVANPRQRAALVERSKREIAGRGAKTRHLASTARAEFVRPMFEAMWASAVVSFSVLLESSDDDKVVAQCLDGFRCGAHIACTYYMETERAAYVGGLEKFTLLTSLKDMRPRNIAAIRTLISIASSEGNFLQDSWVLVLNCLSQLERMHLLKGVDTAVSLTASPVPPSASPLPKQTTPRTPQPGADSPSVVLDAELLTAIEKIYTDTQNLNDRAIVDFVRALCQVAASEFGTPAPRVFSLQKLTDVALANISRVRFVWSQMWETLKRHFFDSGCHDNVTVAVQSIGSLKQIALHFLEKDELANYNFQKEFLKPFELVFAATQHAQIKELVISSLKQIVTTRSGTIRSGWNVVFATLAMAVAKDTKILCAAFDTLSDVVRSSYDLVAPGFFVELIDCLVVFGNNTSQADVCMKSVSLLGDCAERLIKGMPAVPKDESQPGDYQFTDCFAHISLWFPLLAGLTGIVSHIHIDVRSAALKALFNVFIEHGDAFSPRFWELGLRAVLLPLFSNVGYDHVGRVFRAPVSDDSEWLATTCLNALQSLVTLFTRYFRSANFLLPDVMSLLRAFIMNENSALAGVASACLYQLVMDNGPEFTRDMWRSFTQIISRVCESDSDLLNRLYLTANPAPAGVAPEPSAKEAEQETAAANEAPAIEEKAEGSGLQEQPPAETEKPTEAAEPQEAKPTTGTEAAADTPKPETPKMKPRVERNISGRIGSPKHLRRSSIFMGAVANQLTPSEAAIVALQRTCATCGVSEIERSMLRCPLCSTRQAAPRYCSLQCQRDDWVLHGPVCLARYAGKLQGETPQLQPLEAPNTIAGMGLTPMVLSGRLEIARATIKAVEEIVYKQYANLSDDNLREILDAVAASAEASQHVFESQTTRSLMQRSGVSDITRKTCETVTRLFKMLFHVFGDKNSEVRRTLAEDRLIPAFTVVLEGVANTGTEAPQGQWLNVVLTVLGELLNVSDAQYRKHAAHFWPLFVKLLMNNSNELRALLCQHVTHAGNLYGITPRADVSNPQ